MKPSSTVTALSAALAIVFTGQVMAEDESLPGNRYDKERRYTAEISASEAYLEMMHSKGHNKWHRHRSKPVIIDVRRLREYAAGHPEKAYNVPFPHIVDSNDQDPEYFIDQVYDIVNGDLDRKIMLLCRTGSRSVDAGNLLADAGFTNVHNIWEGFVGQYKYAYAGGNIAYEVDADGNVVFTRLDLNNDGEITSPDIADVYEETADKNPDKDGWRNFMELPWTTKLRRPLAYENNVWQYREFMTPVD
jgi:rhodanese-related sulfurtransferase